MVDKKEQSDHIAKWFASPLGSYVLNKEREKLKQHLEFANNLNILILGNSVFNDFLPELYQKIMRSYVCHIAQESTHATVQVIAALENIPILNDSIDIIILPHSLELAEDKQQALAEMYRILAPEGKVYIFSFNSISLWSVVASIKGVFSKFQFNTNTIGFFKLHSLIRNTGFDIMHLSTLANVLPINSKFWLSWQRWLDKLRVWPSPFGGVNFLILHKRVLAMPFLTKKMFVKKVKYSDEALGVEN